MAVGELVAAGDEALGAGRWREAREAYATALESAPQEAGAVDGLGAALWWLGEPVESIAYRERAYAAFRRTGEGVRAAWAALNAAIVYQTDLDNAAAARGWLARAERTIAATVPPEHPMWGWYGVIRAYVIPDQREALRLCVAALDTARVHGDVDLELCALSGQGRALVATGHPERGLALVDEAMAGVYGGVPTTLDTVAYASCDMLAACDLAADLTRATQWCRLVDEFVRTYGCPFLYAHCRTLYGGILVATGHWKEAEEELSEAIRMAEHASPATRTHARGRLAELRLRQGRLADADQLVRACPDQLAVSVPTAGLSIAKGDPRAAVALLERRLADLGDRHPEAAPALDLLVQAHLLRRNVSAASSAAGRLAALAHERENDHVTALAALAEARVSIVEGRSVEALAELEKAVRGFARLGLPLDTARARLLLARVLADDAPEAAEREAGAALATAVQLGAPAEVDAATTLLARVRDADTDRLTPREREVLRLVGLGLSNPEIAARLFISRKTAAHHVSNVLAKLGVRNRAEAVAYALSDER